MSETTNAKPAAGGGSRDLGIFALVVVVIVGAIWFFSGSPERDIARSATGFNGLVSWLRAEGVEARTFSGGGQMVRGDAGLRILPLYDTDLEQRLIEPSSREQVIGQTDEIDIPRYVVSRKMRLQPTLVILPKWRGGMRRLGMAHRDLLIPVGKLNRLAQQIDRNLGRVQQDPTGWETLSANGPSIGLHHPQIIRAGRCTPLVGTREAMILGRCPITSAKKGDEEPEFWLLADPDLANNHGLNWAANADVVAEQVRAMAGGKPVILDLTRDVATVEQDWQLDDYERTWEDVVRMFRWPFTMIWIAFAMLGALVLWRAVTRYGPLARFYDEEPRASKEVSIEAKARLLRLADHDTALLTDHFRARLAHLAGEILGPHRPPDRDPLAVLTRLIERRKPDLARELAEAAEIPDTRLGQGEILRRLDRFENCYDKVTHEFGRAERAG